MKQTRPLIPATRSASTLAVSAPEHSMTAGAPAPSVRSSSTSPRSDVKTSMTWLRAERDGQRAPLLDGVGDDDAGTYPACQGGRTEPHGPLADHDDRLALGDLGTNKGNVGRAGTARDHRARFEVDLIREKHERRLPRCHVVGVGTVVGHPVGAASLAVLRSTNTALVASTASVVVTHDDARSLPMAADALPQCDDNTARLVTDDRFPELPPTAGERNTRRSEPHSPAARISITTSPVPGVGSSTVSTVRRLSPRKRTPLTSRQGSRATHPR